MGVFQSGNEDEAGLILLEKIVNLKKEIIAYRNYLEILRDNPAMNTAQMIRQINQLLNKFPHVDA